MRAKVFNLLTKPVIVVIVILITAALQLVDNNLSYFFGIFIVLLALWGSKWSWSEFGKHPLQKTVLHALLYTDLIFIVIDICIQPFIEIYVGLIDLSSLDHLRGSLINYVIFILIMWVFAAFGEELLYRGYFMKRVAMLLGNSNKAWLISAFCISVFFGIAHYYQGVSGMIATGLVGLCFALIFYKNRTNLTVAILTHGFYDMIGITLIYFDRETFIMDWVKQFL